MRIPAFALFLSLLLAVLSLSAQVTKSALSQGQWFKLAVATDGMYRLDASYLSSLGIDPASIDPRNIRIHGNGGKILSQRNSDPRPEDLVENAIFVQGEADGSFDAGDYLLFFGEGPHQWDYSSEDKRFQHRYHLYADTNYYYLTVGDVPGKRIEDRSAMGSADYQVSKLRGTHFHELDKDNPLISGRYWLGEKFDLILSRNYSFDLRDAKADGKVRITFRVSARSDRTTSFTFYVGGTALGNVSIRSTSVNVKEAIYYYSKTQTYELDFSQINQDSLNLRIEYSKNGSNRSEGWLDWIEVDYDIGLSPKAKAQWPFRLEEGTEAGKRAGFSVSGLDASYQLWDVTDPMHAIRQPFTMNGSTAEFVVPADSVLRFWAAKGNYLIPVGAEAIPNQNLHGISMPDYLMIAHPVFFAEAERLADFHRQQFQRSVVIVSPEQIYNEFSSGKQDVSAIRDFIRMIYQRSGGMAPMFVLMFGDGTYDFKNITTSALVNFVPTYESRNSTNPTSSYGADDFFTFMGENEGFWGEGSGMDGDAKLELNLMDLAIGRFPVENATQAKDVVDKIIEYVSNPDGNNFGSWRNEVVLVADHKDSDGSVHASQADAYDKLIYDFGPCYKVEKLYMDNYPMIKTAGRTRFPQGKEALLNALDEGSLIVNYTGHGGEEGWSNSFILDVTDINRMQNPQRYSAVVTATCEFGRFDNHGRRSGGEDMLVLREAGAIALFTTLRLVYSYPNFILNKNFYREVFKFDSTLNRMPTMGEVMVRTKNASFGGGNLANINSRAFAFLGDPGISLSYPQQRALITEINDNPVGSGVADTLKSLALISVKGKITDVLGNPITDMNGEMDVTVFDKPAKFTTLRSKFTFFWQKNKIFNGRASVDDGQFEFQFKVPIDISYEQNGYGKIGLYFFDQQTDGTGCQNDLVVGGTDASAAPDDEGPEVNLFINDDQWISGGITDPNPYLYAELYDESGINTVGGSIGHEITAMLDDENGEVIILNDYYSSTLNNYQEGTVRFPLSDVTEGEHKLRIRVWDNANNVSESTTRFIVTSDATTALQTVLNYPNPFEDLTTFRIMHNRAGRDLEIQISIYDFSGRAVKTLTDRFTATGNVYESLSWDGKTDSGDEVSNGYYVYRVLFKDLESNQLLKETRKLILIRP